MFTQAWSSAEMLARCAVLVPCYEADAYIRNCIDNIRSAASEKEVHIILIDDGSSVPVHHFLNSDDLGLIVLRSEKNKGLVEALNSGLRFALSAGYIYAARQDADDTSSSDRFRRQLAVLDGTDKTLCVSGYRMQDEKGTLIAHRPAPSGRLAIRWTLDFRNPFAHSSFVFRLAGVEALGFYRETFKYAEDYELLLRAERMGQLVSIRDCLVGYTVNDQGISSARMRQAKADIKAAFAHPRLSPIYLLGILKKVSLLFVDRHTITFLQRLLFR